MLHISKLLSKLIWGKKGVCNIRCNYDVILNCEHRVCLTSVTVNRVLEALYKVLQRAYPENTWELKVNPQAHVEFSKKDCLISLGEQELLLEYHNATMKKQVEKLLSGHEIDLSEKSIREVIEVLNQQNVLFKVPVFN